MSCTKTEVRERKKMAHTQTHTHKSMYNTTHSHTDLLGGRLRVHGGQSSLTRMSFPLGGGGSWVAVGWSAATHTGWDLSKMQREEAMKGPFSCQIINVI